MTPVSPQNYKGIAYIHLNNLPNDQRLQISDWMPVTEFIKIKIAEDIIDKCVNYQDYLHWYENFYSQAEDYESQI